MMNCSCVVRSNNCKQQRFFTCFGFDGCVGLSHALIKLQVEERTGHKATMARCSEQCMSYVVREPVFQCAISSTFHHLLILWLLLLCFGALDRDVPRKWHSLLRMQSSF